MDVERARADLDTVAPDLHQQGIARDDFARMLHQQREQIVFLAGQRHLLGVEYHSLLSEVHREMFVAVRHYLVNIPCLQHSHTISLNQHLWLCYGRAFRR